VEEGVPIPEPLQEELVIMRDELGLSRYHFPFENKISGFAATFIF